MIFTAFLKVVSLDQNQNSTELAKPSFNQSGKMQRLFRIRDVNSLSTTDASKSLSTNYTSTSKTDSSTTQTKTETLTPPATTKRSANSSTINASTTTPVSSSTLSTGLTGMCLLKNAIQKVFNYFELPPASLSPFLLFVSTKTFQL